MRFQSQNPVVFKFLLRSVEGTPKGPDCSYMYTYTYRENDLHYSTLLLKDNQSLTKVKQKINPRAIPQLDQMHRACYFAGISIFNININICDFVNHFLISYKRKNDPEFLGGSISFAVFSIWTQIKYTMKLIITIKNLI